ncbi:hypothetical protein DID88_010412 [Monilinia fructigena]|uniref:chitin synthase n=1 Tax=Monilinia fructigena TaxID=38457 RepID=A0A395ILP5_9HELO|nr:hypothetical protein DID88_010412 [Monilinia fructigena]
MPIPSLQQILPLAWFRHSWTTLDCSVSVERTSLTNSKSSFVTMIQVYEYFISHNLAKAFESLFGSVTCLPGCFTMYRLRAADSGKPLFVSREIVDNYAVTRVDTLHMKNLLHLGEDRYLTTLLMKYHGKYKTKYISTAYAWTIAPDSWAVFLSQRRRWINSTVHNLAELVPMAELCGFCCFSMRFIVMIDLVSTLVQPVTVAYIVYLIVLVIESPSYVPITAFILLAAIYVFWHMDDFSWGNTRVVTGEKGKQIVITDEGVFDPASIPKKKWEDYQAELWEAQTQQDDDGRSVVSGYSYGTKYHPGVSEYAIPASGLMSQYNGYGLDPKNPYQSRVSLAPSDMGLGTPGNRASQFSGSQYFEKYQVGVGEEILVFSLDVRRAYINSATEALLSGQL